MQSCTWSTTEFKFYSSLQLLFLFVFKFFTRAENKRGERERNSPLLKNKFLNFWGGPGWDSPELPKRPLYYHATCLHIELITLPHCKPTCIFVYLCSSLSRAHTHTRTHTHTTVSCLCHSAAIALPLSLMHTQTSLSVWQLWWGEERFLPVQQNLNNGKMIHGRSQRHLSLECANRSLPHWAHLRKKCLIVTEIIRQLNSFDRGWRLNLLTFWIGLLLVKAWSCHKVIVKWDVVTRLNMYFFFPLLNLP